MNTFKRKALSAAVLAGLGAAGTAEAVYLNPNGTGQVLVYPYYTVQTAGGNSWNTYLSVVNTTTRAKAVKVRVLEGKSSQEVLDFNLFLSPNDVWTAAIVPANTTDTSSPGHLLTADVSCTSPVIGATGVDFRNFQYAQTSPWSLAGAGLDRTREGYVEMIEMGILTGTTATNITHVNGVPANCNAVLGPSFTPTDIAAPTGGLMGTGTLINVNNGQDAGYKADALEAWSRVSQYQTPSSTLPNIGQATPPVSLVINAGGIDPVSGASMQATAYLTDFSANPAAGFAAVASVYMHTDVMNEYILDTATRSNTDWVITQPTKFAFVAGPTAIPPFSNVFTSSGACEFISFTYFNREEQGATANPGDFSPPPPSAPANTLCWESTVLSIRNGSSQTPTGTTSGVLGSVNTTPVVVNSGFQNGWADLRFIGANSNTVLSVSPPSTGTVGMGGTGQQVSLNNLLPLAATAGAAAGITFFGLPATGFMIRNFNNGNLSCTGVGGGSTTCQGSYGSLFNHSYRTVVRP